MKRIAPGLLAALLVSCAPRVGQSFEWRTDLSAAAEDARQGQKLLLLDFSGSDWCMWCKRLDAEVFSTDAFKTYADANLVCLVADFPRSAKQDPALQAQNERLARHFQVQGFPTILLFSPDGELIGQLGYQPGGPEAFIRAIQQAHARYAMRPPDRPAGPKLPLD